MFTSLLIFIYVSFCAGIETNRSVAIASNLTTSHGTSGVYKLGNSDNRRQYDPERLLIAYTQSLNQILTQLNKNQARQPTAIEYITAISLVILLLIKIYKIISQFLPQNDGSVRSIPST